MATSAAFRMQCVATKAQVTRTGKMAKPVAAVRSATAAGASLRGTNVSSLFISRSTRHYNNKRHMVTAAAEPETKGIDAEGDAPGKPAKTRPSHAEESRTLMELATTCFLATAAEELDGHPSGSVVDVACDDMGRPIFAISTLSAHTRDLANDPRCSVVVQATNFSGIQDARTTLVGTMAKVSEEEEASVKEAFMAKHPNAFWVNFADFSIWRMDDLKKVRFVGGFGRAGAVSAEKYFEAKPDPVAAFTPMIAGHMNADHKDAILAMLDHYGGLKADDGNITGIDRLGMDIQVKKGNDTWKQRLPFISPAEDRKGVKDVMVEMTKTAAIAAKAAAEAEESEGAAKEE